MGELLSRAWQGWLYFMGAGKLPTLLFLSFLLFGFLGLGDKRQRELVGYSVVMVLICVFPVSAAVLLRYQTDFYDYPWIWGLLPMTAGIACGGVLFLEWMWKRSGGSGLKSLGLLAAMIVICFLCGWHGGQKWQTSDQESLRRQMQSVLEEISSEQNGQICLWAPREVVSCARSLDGGIRLLYGRNMWLEHLDAFAYDEYTDRQREFYVWMEMAERYGTLNVLVAGDTQVVGAGPEVGTVLEGIPLIRDAISMGANTILLPGSMREEALKELEEVLGLYAERMNNYYLIKVSG